ncbi:MAG TPA: hypothetical protein VFW10_00680 [Steroidobacteraceae bacterium]|nr:hypothetical protein [Steroidobacteraceae bacterium]
MPELLSTSIPTQLRRLVLPAAGALMLYGLPAYVLAQEASAGLRACAAESDPARRLACYDREMGRKPTPSTPPAAQARPAAANHSMRSASAPAIEASAATPAPAPTAAPAPTPSSTSTPATAANHDAPTRLRLPSWKMLAGGDTWQLTAQVSSLERWPDAMVLHLDNGQVWQQTGRASGDLSLHEGDSVTIQKHLGSYWLSSRYVSNMKVRQKPQ